MSLSLPLSLSLYETYVIETIETLSLYETYVIETTETRLFDMQKCPAASAPGCCDFHLSIKTGCTVKLVVCMHDGYCLLTAFARTALFFV